MAKLIDANVILRNLLEDIPEQAEMARFVPLPSTLNGSWTLWTAS